jgi:hypothetical protein
MHLLTLYGEGFPEKPPDKNRTCARFALISVIFEWNGQIDWSNEMCRVERSLIESETGYEVGFSFCLLIRGFACRHVMEQLLGV